MLQLDILLNREDVSDQEKALGAQFAAERALSEARIRHNEETSKLAQESAILRDYLEQFKERSEEKVTRGPARTSRAGTHCVAADQHAVLQLGEG